VEPTVNDGDWTFEDVLGGRQETDAGLSYEDVMASLKRVTTVDTFLPLREGYPRTTVGVVGRRFEPKTYLRGGEDV